MKNANLQNTDLTGCSFSESNLEKASLSNSKINNTDFSNAFLNIIDFEGIKLQNADFTNTHLSLELTNFLDALQSSSNYQTNQKNQLSIERELWSKIIKLRTKLLSKYKKYESEFEIDVEDIFSDVVTQIFSNSRDINSLNKLGKTDLTSQLSNRLYIAIRQRTRSNIELMSIDLADHEIEYDDENQIITYHRISILDEIDKYHVNPEHQFELKEKRALINEIANFIKKNMKPEYYVIFELYFIEENRINEISQQVNLSRIQTYRSIQHLKKVIRANFSN